MKYIVKEYNKDKQVAIHLFSTPEYGEPNFYRLVNSMNAFRSHKKWHTNGDIQYYVIPKDEFDVTAKNLLKISVEAAQAYRGHGPTIEHSSQEAFYKYIGWDCKTHKYNNTPKNKIPARRSRAD